MNISPIGTPGIILGSAPTSLVVASPGRFAIVGGFGSCGWVGRLDLDPKNPLGVAYTPFAPGVPLANGWTAALSNDEREIRDPAQHQRLESEPVHRRVSLTPGVAGCFAG